MAVASQNIRKTNHELFEEDRNKLAIGYRLTLGFVFCILGLNSTNYAYGQSIVNNSKFKNLKVEVDKRVDVKVGGNDCGTTITRLRSVGNAVVITAIAPSNKQCSFVNLSLSIGSKSAPLKALDGGYKFQDVEAGYRRGDGVANADMWFEPFDAGLLSAANLDIKLSDSACTGSQCIAQCLSSKCGQNAKVLAVQRQKQEVQERREAADRDEQYRRDAPARQARQMCEAQNQTCLASCGDRIGAFTSQGIASGEYARIGKCETSCRSIGCN